MTTFNAERGKWLIPGIEARLIALHSSPEDLAFTEIAKMISVEFGVTLTKNAIAGRVHRLCLPLRARPRVSKGPTQIRKRKPIMIEVKPVEVPLVASLTCEGISLLDLHDECCHWPIGEHPNVRYCGGVRFRRSYCKKHFKAAYVLPREWARA